MELFVLCLQAVYFLPPQRVSYYQEAYDTNSNPKKLKAIRPAKVGESLY